MMYRFRSDAFRVTPLCLLLSLAVVFAFAGPTGCLLTSEEPLPTFGPQAEAFRDAGPRARLTRPNFNPDIPIRQTVAEFVAEWDAFDSGVDVSGPPRPAAFEYKAARVNIVTDTPSQILEKLESGENVFGEQGGDPIAWTRVPPSVRRLERSLAHGSQLAFAVRAVDAKGAPEPELEYDRNYVTFVATSDENVGPVVEAHSVEHGSFTFFPYGETWEVQVVPGVPFMMDWVADASGYGYYVGDTNYALDVPDPEDLTPSDPNGIGGWIGWERRNALEAPYFFGPEDAGSVHTLYLWVRDDLHTHQTLATVQIEVLDVPFEARSTSIELSGMRVGD
ncbi:MAG: hypothetical protein H6682_16405 [Candidatus Eisenbacteria bacterium]|nr:hypothetical protein [Candidatus Eisenbacteria bacterium]